MSVLLPPHFVWHSRAKMLFLFTQIKFVLLFVVPFCAANNPMMAMAMLEATPAFTNALTTVGTQLQDLAAKNRRSFHEDSEKFLNNQKNQIDELILYVSADYQLHNLNTKSTMAACYDLVNEARRAALALATYQAEKASIIKGHFDEFKEVEPPRKLGRLQLAMDWIDTFIKSSLKVLDHVLPIYKYVHHNMTSAATAVSAADDVITFRLNQYVDGALAEFDETMGEPNGVCKWVSEKLYKVPLLNSILCPESTYKISDAIRIIKTQLGTLFRNSRLSRKRLRTLQSFLLDKVEQIEIERIQLEELSHTVDQLKDTFYGRVNTDMPAMVARLSNPRDRTIALMTRMLNDIVREGVEFMDSVRNGKDLPSFIQILRESASEVQLDVDLFNVREMISTNVQNMIDERL